MQLLLCSLHIMCTVLIHVDIRIVLLISVETFRRNNILKLILPDY